MVVEQTTKDAFGYGFKDGMKVGLPILAKHNHATDPIQLAYFRGWGSAMAALAAEKERESENAS